MFTKKPQLIPLTLLLLLLSPSLTTVKYLAPAAITDASKLNESTKDKNRYYSCVFSPNTKKEYYCFGSKSGSIDTTHQGAAYFKSYDWTKTTPTTQLEFDVPLPESGTFKVGYVFNQDDAEISATGKNSIVLTAFTTGSESAGKITLFAEFGAFTGEILVDGDIDSMRILYHETSIYANNRAGKKVHYWHRSRLGTISDGLAPGGSGAPANWVGFVQSKDTLAIVDILSHPKTSMLYLLTPTTVEKIRTEDSSGNRVPVNNDANIGDADSSALTPSGVQAEHFTNFDNDMLIACSDSTNFLLIRSLTTSYQEINRDTVGAGQIILRGAMHNIPGTKMAVFISSKDTSAITATKVWVGDFTDYDKSTSTMKISELGIESGAEGVVTSIAVDTTVTAAPYVFFVSGFSGTKAVGRFIKASLTDCPPGCKTCGDTIAAGCSECEDMTATQTVAGFTKCANCTITNCKTCKFAAAVETCETCQDGNTLSGDKTKCARKGIIAFGFVVILMLFFKFD